MKNTITKQDLEQWLEAMNGDTTCAYERVQYFLFPAGMKDRLQELCELALKGLEK